MNSLEFIENQIKEINKQIDYYKRQIDEDSMFKSFIESYTNTIKELTNLKDIFQQIKTELEAWEKLEQENFDLRQTLNTENENCVMLEKRIKELNSELEVEKWSSIGIWEENKTLKKVIEILKDKFFIDIIEREFDYKIGFQPKTPIKNGIETRFAQLDNDKANTLKEALEVKDEK